MANSNVNEENKTVVIEMVKIENSEAINAIGYHEDCKTLRIEFAGEEVYRYFGVESNVFEALLLAPSLGNGFHTQIRKDKSIKFMAE